MMEMRTTICNLFIAVLMFVFPFALFGQSGKPEIFGVDKFIEQVKQFHPLAKQAGILVSMAEANLLSAKGNFDPSLNIEADRKTFDGKNYFFHTDPEITVPLPVGNLRAGLENNGGDNLFSEYTRGKSSYAGLELPLARGLLLDKRRAALQQARLYKNQSQQEQLQMLNDLLLDAYTSYWQWSYAWQRYQLYDQFIHLAENRLRLIRIAFQQGDKSAMDTVEASAQLQTYLLGLADAQIMKNNTALVLSNFLWTDQDTVWNLPANYQPDTNSDPSRLDFVVPEELISVSDALNPQLKAYELKIKGLEIDQRLKAQNLLPYLTLKGNILYKDYYVFKSIDPGYIQNNYKWGISFSMPLFLRNERGNYQQSKLKLKDAGYGLSLKKQQINSKIRSYAMEANLMANQLQTLNKMEGQYRYLLQNETLKYTQGESSLFMVNSRESKLMDLLQKRIETNIKFLKAKYAAQWAAGSLR
ncbi:MAG: TolC family protein [Bacteroidota bacterium]|nr:TolC family protein [Bacteroidota bacterium]